ncbi:MAG: hypothetical protein WCK05_05820, partial [Planctomycetota bacterium]
LVGGVWLMWLLNYNLSGLFLKEKPVSAAVFASHSENLRDRDFAQSALFNDDRRGITVYTKGNFPTTFLAETDLSHETSDLRDVTTDTKHYRATVADRRNDDWLTELTFDRKDKAETAIYSPSTGGGTTTQDLPDLTDEATLTHNWRFGPGPEKHSLVGRYDFLNETGSYMNKTFGAEESLQLVHSDTLTSFYSASYSNNKTVDDTDVTKTAEVGLTKQFYDSLQLTGRLDGRDETTNTSSDKTLRGTVEADYQKKTLIGLYNSSLNLYREEEKQQSSTGSILIQRQPITLPDDYSWVQLSRPNVIGSILVIDSVTDLPYFEGTDYELQLNGAFTQIRKRPFTSTIPPGGTVLLTYNVQAANNAVIGRQGVTWNNRLTLDKVPLSFYINAQNLDEWLITGDDPGSINPQTGVLYGMEWNFKGFQVTVEHENRTMLLSPPWVANRIRAGYHGNLSRNVDFSVSANAEKLQYLQAAQFDLEPGQDFMNTVGANFSVNARLNNYTLLRFSSDIMKTQGQENRTTFRNTAGLVWQYGKMDLALEARYDTMTQDVTSGTITSVMFTLKRKF